MRCMSFVRILPKSDTGRVRYTEHIVGDGERVFRELEKRKLEGMVAKRADSLYVSGRTRAWLKVKTNAGRQEMRIRSETWGHGYKWCSRPSLGIDLQESRLALTSKL